MRGSRGISERRTDFCYAAAALILTLYLLYNLKAFLYFETRDITLFYGLWLKHIVHHGRLASLEASYTNYTPPYVYLLSLFSLLYGKVNPVVLIKLVELPGLLCSSILGWSICRAMGCSKPRSLLGAWLIVVAPETVLNAIAWGQSDVMQTVWLLLCVRLLMGKKPNWAMAALGVAVSIKLQALFIGGLVAAMLLAGEIPIASTLFAPISYVLVMVPAALAGRPWKALLGGIYHQQFGAYPNVGSNVANFWELLVPWTENSPRARGFISGLAYLIALAATVGLVRFLRRSPGLLSGSRLIGAAVFTLLMEPFLLPRMHERYYFPGDVLVILLAMAVPEMTVPAVLLQMATTMTYHTQLAVIPETTPYYIAPALMVAAALFLLGRKLLGETNHLVHEETPSLSIQAVGR